MIETALQKFTAAKRSLASVQMFIKHEDMALPPCRARGIRWEAQVRVRPHAGLQD